MAPLTIPKTSTLPPVVLFGQPNVGKSALFAALTGARAIVSNYPGTTVDVSRGRCEIAGAMYPVHDTPGAYSLLPVSDEERIARDSLFAGEISTLLHIVDAKNLDRSLGTTLELLDAGLPVVLVLNMSDEAEAAGIRIDVAKLGERLGCVVVQTVATHRHGIDAVRRAIADRAARPRAGRGEVGRLWAEELGPAVAILADARAPDAALPRGMAPMTAAALAIRGSKEVAQAAGFSHDALQAARRDVQARTGGMPPVAAILALRARAARLLEGVFVRPTSRADSLRDRLGVWLAHPLLGLPVLAFVLYVGFYWIVGQIAAGTLVKLLEEGLFGGYVNVWLDALFTKLVPWPWLKALFVGDYGVFTLGITYAFALVLPVVGAFFIVFSIVEDSGYFPRLALLCDRLFKKVGLNGRAVITMVLGLGCATMATVTTRTLETRRERVIATLLLVLAVPCSAQLGLITGLLAMHGFTLWLAYLGCLLAIFLAVGWLAARVLPGSGATFHMEMPPLRWPRISNVLRKTWMRLVWYFREVVPLFLWASVILWALDQTKVLLALQHGIEPAMALIGLPVSAAESFLIGFFRRDFGAAGLFSLAESTTSLTSRQLLTGSVTLTLFVPCVASFMMMCKERGWRVGLAIFVLVTVFALGAGGLLNWALLALGYP
jgi:ferrous iron transport protein B